MSMSTQRTPGVRPPFRTRCGISGERGTDAIVFSYFMPPNPRENLTWIDTENGFEYVYISGQWRHIYSGLVYDANLK